MIEIVQLAGGIGIEGVADFAHGALAAAGNQRLGDEEADRLFFVGAVQFFLHARGEHDLADVLEKLIERLVNVHARGRAGEFPEVVDGHVVEGLDYFREHAFGKWLARLEQHVLARRVDAGILHGERLEFVQVGNQPLHRFLHLLFRAELGFRVDDNQFHALVHDVHGIGIALAGGEGGLDQLAGLPVLVTLGKFRLVGLDAGRELLGHLVDGGLDGEDAPRGQGLSLVVVSHLHRVLDAVGDVVFPTEHLGDGVPEDGSGIVVGFLCRGGADQLAEPVFRRAGDGMRLAIGNERGSGGLGYAASL